MAIDDLLEEDEHITRFRTWFRQHGVSLGIGVVVGLGVIAGWHWLQSRQQTVDAAVYQRYETVLDLIQANALDKALTQSAALNQTKAGIYAPLTALKLSKALVAAGRRHDAIAVLRTALQSDDYNLRFILQQRLARLLLDDGKPLEAVGVVKGADDVLSLDVLGDAYTQAGQLDLARTAYTTALKQTDSTSPYFAILAAKLTDIGGAVPQSAVLTP